MPPLAPPQRRPAFLAAFLVLEGGGGRHFRCGGPVASLGAHGFPGVLHALFLHLLLGDAAHVEVHVPVPLGSAHGVRGGALRAGAHPVSHRRETAHRGEREPRVQDAGHHPVVGVCALEGEHALLPVLLAQSVEEAAAEHVALPAEGPHLREVRSEGSRRGGPPRVAVPGALGPRLAAAALGLEVGAPLFDGHGPRRRVHRPDRLRRLGSAFSLFRRTGQWIPVDVRGADVRGVGAAAPAGRVRGPVLDLKAGKLAAARSHVARQQQRHVGVELAQPIGHPVGHHDVVVVHDQGPGRAGVSAVRDQHAQHRLLSSVVLPNLDKGRDREHALGAQLWVWDRKVARSRRVAPGRLVGGNHRVSAAWVIRVAHCDESAPVRLVARAGNLLGALAPGRVPPVCQGNLFCLVEPLGSRLSLETPWPAPAIHNHVLNIFEEGVPCALCQGVTRIRHVRGVHHNREEVG
mmetsp:Transcript_21806/g.49326  ORF Transcript_21806/g.49326 Transcript_21806/m.49326 type:complete len:462 (+) Transcript_21806:295-1680(+)